MCLLGDSKSILGTTLRRRGRCKMEPSNEMQQLGLIGWGTQHTWSVVHMKCLEFHCNCLSLSRHFFCPVLFPPLGLSLWVELILATAPQSSSVEGSFLYSHSPYMACWPAFKFIFREDVTHLWVCQGILCIYFLLFLINFIMKTIIANKNIANQS